MEPVVWSELSWGLVLALLAFPIVLLGLALRKNGRSMTRRRHAAARPAAKSPEEIEAEREAEFEDAMATFQAWAADDGMSDPGRVINAISRAGHGARRPEEKARLVALVEAIFDAVLSRAGESKDWANLARTIADTAGMLSHDIPGPDRIRATLEARLADQTADGAPWDDAAQETYYLLRANLRTDPAAAVPLVERLLQAGLADRPLTPSYHADLARLHAKSAQVIYGRAADLLVPGGRIEDARALLSSTRLAYPRWLRDAGRLKEAREAALALRAQISGLNWEEDEVDEKGHRRIREEFDTFLAELKRCP